MQSCIEDESGVQPLTTLQYEPRPEFRASSLQDDSALAPCKGKRIGILIVTYNAITTLVPVLKRITPNVWQNVEEVLIFDDASQDATFELALGVQASWRIPKLRVFKHARNLGYGGNQKAGYRYFMEEGFDIVVLLHGDGQYAPEILSHLYAPIVQGKADAVFGSRMMKTYGGALKGGMPLYKFVGNKILTAVENRMLGLALTEFHSGYRAYNLHALRRIDLSNMTDDFHFDTEIIIKLHHQHFRIAETPIPTYYGKELCYVNGLRYAANVVRAVLHYKNTCRSVTCAPEFAEYFVNYAIKRSRHSSHSCASRLIGSRQRVLDIGCGRGTFASQLAANGNLVTGIDQVAGETSDPAIRLIRGDLDGVVEPVFEQLRTQPFDRVLLLDVLEHLHNPERILQLSHKVLSKNGRLIVSVPNIANLAVRLSLLFGRFTYASRGLLDRTHVRFFTYRTAQSLLESTGYEVLSTRVTNVPLELVVGLLSPDGRLMTTLDAILRIATVLMPRLLGYQIVLVARSLSSGKKEETATISASA